MTSERDSLTGLALCLLLLLPGCWPQKPEPVVEFGVEEYDRIVVLTNEQKSFLVQAARRGLRGEPIPDPGSSLSAIEGAGASIEVFLPPQKPVIRIVGGERFYETFKTAVSRAASDETYRLNIQPNLRAARIKVGIIERVFQLPVASSRTVATRVEAGVHGFILVKDGRAYYQHPDLVQYNGWGLNIREPSQRKKRIRASVLVRRQLEVLSREATGEDAGWKSSSLYAFTLHSFIDRSDAAGSWVDSFRGKSRIPSLDAASIKAATIANLDYLSRVLNEDGRLDYLYYPVENEYDSRYYLPHHAGYVLRHLQAYRHFGEKKHLHEARRALSVLTEQTITPTKAPHIAIVQADGESSIGPNALMAMILAEMPEAEMSAKEKELRDKFGESILFFRAPKAGHFYTTYEQALTKTEPNKQALYFPGVAMLALVRLHERTGEKKWWDAAVEVSQGQAELWRKAGHRSVGKFCWVGQAWARMARVEKDSTLGEGYKRLGYSHADAVLRHQWTPQRAGFYPDYLGAADNSRPPRTTPTSARAESLIENYLTAKQFEDIDAQKKYGVALLQALHFVVSNQYSNENSWYLPEPERARGGIRGGLTAGDIRIDYNQHALFAMIHAIEIPEQLRALGVSKW